MAAGTVASAAGHHGRRRGTCRRAQFRGYGPRFDEPGAPGSSGGSRELVQAEKAPEGRAEAAVAMAGEAEVVGAPENGHTRHHLPKETVREGEEGTDNLTAGKNEGGEDSGTADHAEGWTANHDNLRRGGFQLPRLERVRNGSGEAAGGAGKGSARFCRGRARGDAPTTRTWARSGGCGLAVRLARGEREDGESADARALTVSG